jgi:hypothetical protein
MSQNSLSYFIDNNEKRFLFDYLNLCQSKHNTFHMHRLFSLQHVSAAYAGGGAVG